ncbi:MAG TPA: NAD-dependent dehydratase [Chloroflexi bacterium]|nr:NAD-dependent dehydratase [Chloroflexota bacterium]
MNALVTGATGFVGSAVVRALLARGAAVRTLARAGSNRLNLAGLDGVTTIEGDLTQPESLAAAVRGCDTVFHVAAFYSTREEDARLMYQINVGGTKNLLQAARAAGVTRFVHCSTIGTVGRPRGGGLPTEDDEFLLWETSSHYARSKYLAEELAVGACSAGLPVVVVNPCAPVGVGDIKPSSSGQRVLDYLEGRMPKFLDGGINFISVEDVAAGHILAAERGRIGQRYILGHRDGNLPLDGFLALMERVTSLPRPGLQEPRASWRLLRRLRQPPAGAAPLPSMAPAALTCNPAKAIRELGLPQTPLDQALCEAVIWFGRHGYIRRARRVPKLESALAVSLVD